MSEMIERVARVIEENIYSETGENDFVKAARAAIEAMRELTPEIDSALADYGAWDAAYPSHLAWNDAIDAALKDTSNG